MHPALLPRSTPTAALHLGTMNFGGRTPHADAVALIHAALDAGIPLVDTANVYTDGASERIVGEATRGRDVLVATKVGYGQVNGRPEGLSRAAILRAAEGSLSRLGRDHIDLYYLHLPDPSVPVEETLDALATLHTQGRIRHWGVSNFASWQILELQQRAPAFGLTPPVASQMLYNPLVRQLDVEYFRFAAAHPIHTTVYNVLAAGLLARVGPPPPKSRLATNGMYKRRYGSDALRGAADQFATIAAEGGLSPLQLAYAFVAQRPGVDSILLGPGTRAHFDDAVTACAQTVAPELLAAAEQVYVDLVGTDVRYAR